MLTNTYATLMLVAVTCATVCACCALTLVAACAMGRVGGRAL